ncbi:MAG: inositol monophosphatase, partial [Actinomycetaceae bacterium]|nr:inositol monophosphatase [Actinomycetaceae bacterium]
MELTKEEREEITRLAEDVASGLAQFAWEKRLAGITVTGTKTSDVDIVTEVDTLIEDLARERIAAARPQDAFLGEEGNGSDGYSGLTWIVDPIDGTVNYFYGVGTCAVSVAVVSGVPQPSLWTVEAACIAYIGDNQVYKATRGQGAYRNGHRIHVSDAQDLASSLVATGFSYEADKRAQQGAVVAQMLPRVRDIRRIGAASTDFCCVAAGLLDGYWESGLKPWDMAAGILIVSEAGGVVENFTRNPAD